MFAPKTMSEEESDRNGVGSTSENRQTADRNNWTNVGGNEIVGNAYDVQDKLRSPRYGRDNFLINDLDGKRFTVDFVKERSFKDPMLFKDKDSLGLRVPDGRFSVGDVCKYVGPMKKLEVTDVRTRRTFKMSTREWTAYYENAPRDRLLEVASPEISHTGLARRVTRPKIVEKLDWFSCVWPARLKGFADSGSAERDRSFPKVQVYCSMRVNGCYTDFEINFGGTSAWYHVLKGTQAFWLIPPTEFNFKLYAQWKLSENRRNAFFGDAVEHCGLVLLVPGDTLFVPSGWIYAVYTGEDALTVFGYFLHSYNMEMQLRVAELEKTIGIPERSKYPFFDHMLWYVLEHYVFYGLGATHLTVDEAERSAAARIERVRFTVKEIIGIVAIVRYLDKQYFNCASKKRAPLIDDFYELIKNVSILIDKHRMDRLDDTVIDHGRAIVPVHGGDDRQKRRFRAAEKSRRDKLRVIEKRQNLREIKRQRIQQYKEMLEKRKNRTERAMTTDPVTVPNKRIKRQSAVFDRCINCCACKSN